MAMAPEEVLRQVRDNHLPDMSEEDAALLAARACGMTVAEIARVSFKARRIISEHLTRLKYAVCFAAGAGLDDAVLGFWVGAHAGCCAANALTLVASGRLLEVLGRGPAKGNASGDAQ